MADIDLSNIEYKRNLERSQTSFPIMYLTDCTQKLGILSMPRVMITAANDHILYKINEELTATPMTNDDKGRSFVSTSSIEIIRVDGVNRLFVKGTGIDTLLPFLVKRGLFDTNEMQVRQRTR